MVNLNHRHIMSFLDDYDVFLFDLWGVIIEGDITYPGVVEQINKIIEQKKVYFVSNAPRPGYIVLKNLINYGFKNISEEMIITSGDVSRSIIETLKVERASDTINIFHLGADRNEDILHNIKHKLVDTLNETDILLLSLYLDEHENINQFDQLLQDAASKNILTICANPDTTIPKHGITRYCAGHFASIIENYGGNVIYTGKPGAEIYNEVLQRESNTPKNRMIMIGDTFETDILGGQNTGIHSALVFTGNASKFHQDYVTLNDKVSSLERKANKLEIYPTFITSIV